MIGRLYRQLSTELRRFFFQLSRLGKILVFIGCTGFGWSSIVVLFAAFNAINKPSAEDQQPYEPPESRHTGDYSLVASRLRGWPTATGKNQRKRCWSAHAIWTNEKILVRGRGSSNGTTVTAWVSETVENEAFLGRYSYDLYYVSQVGTGPHGWLNAWQEARNTRFIERVPPPAPGPPGWRVIQPGQCVLAREKCGDEDETIGKFLFDLPAQQPVHVYTATPFGRSGTSERLLFNGVEVARREAGDILKFDYRTAQSGRYALTIHRSRFPKEGDAECKEGAPFSVKLEWGQVASGSCTYPDDELTCLGDLNND